MYNYCSKRHLKKVKRALYYNQLGCLKQNQGDNKKAIEYYEKALEIRQKTLPPNHPSLATSYNNIGLVYMNMESTQKHFHFTTKALEIQQKTLPQNHPDLATSYNNIGRCMKHGRVLKSTFVLRKST